MNIRINIDFQHWWSKIDYGTGDQNANTNGKHDNQEEEYTGNAEGEEDGLTLFDNIQEDDENNQYASEEETNLNQVLVGSLLGAVISKTEEANKLKPAPFGRKKIKKKKKMETGLLKEILDFKPMGSRRHFSYH